MTIFVKIFLTISMSTIAFVIFFVNYIINIQKEESVNRLNNKIEYHKKINKSTISRLLFDLNREILITNLTSLYLDNDIAKIELNDYSRVINFKIDSKNFKKNLVKSTIILEIENEVLGELNIFYTKEMIQRSINDYKYSIIELSLLLAVVLLGIISYFLKKTTNSINKLTNATNEISSGNLDFIIDINTNDEIGTLANKFDSMRNSLKNRINTINQQLQFQQLLMESVDIPIYIKDEEKYIACNNAFAVFFGKDKSEIINNTSDILIKKEFISIHQETDNKLFEKGGSETYISKLPNGKKELRDIIFFKNTYLDETENKKWIIGTYFDITELNKAKEKIERFNEELQQKVYERTDELNESNEELQATIENLQRTQDKLIESEKLAGLGSLVAGVAHEINTPIGISLTSITHFLDLTNTIKESYKNETMTEEAFDDYLNNTEELARLINSNIERTAQLIKSFKQISADQTSEEKRKFNLKKYVNEVLFSLINITKKENLHINIICNEDINIYSYPGAFSQIITNLIINSVSHAFNGNSNNKKIDISIEKIDNNVKLTYKDNGKGIKKENLEKIFTPFFTTNRKKGNTGLGLNIIYNIITKTLNGSIKCESELNEGVKFTILVEC